MKEFIQSHITQILTIVFIGIFFAIGYGLINLFMNFFIRKAVKRGRDPHDLRIIKRILRAMLWISSLTGLVLIFIGEEHRAVISENSNIAWYIGLVLVISIILNSIIESYFKRSIQKQIERGEDPTSFRFLRYLAIFGVYFIGFLLIILAFPSLRGLAKTALGGAGVLALVAGLASQETFSNIFGGIFIITFKPFKINDIIKVSDDMMGTVTDITLRHTIIKNFENKMIVIPNNIINKEKVVNYDLGDRRVCQWIEVGISYNSDVDLALKILQESCENHPEVLDIRTEEDMQNGIPKVVVRVVKLDDSSVNLKAWAWAPDFGTAFQIKCDLNYELKKRFDAQGIEIPFPHRTVYIRNEFDEPSGEQH